MNRCTKYAPITFLLTGWILWPLQIITLEQVLPKMPSDEALDRGGDSAGHWTHAGNNWWSEMTKINGEYISKLLQFLLWWLLAVGLVRLVCG